ncbi:MAG: helix-turn-helix domain-containing protein [Deltaproteobacteria bacterium]|nr:helix-turn-helix domain-containing protein [Deltaproteobacteria bacterium]
MENKMGFRPREVAQALGLGITLVRSLIARGELRSIKLGRAVIVPRSEVERFIAARMADRQIERQGER